MTCVDCGFDHAEEGVCPRCGYDASQDLIRCVTVENPQISNALEDELNDFCKRVQNDAQAQEKIQERWKVVDNKAREGNPDARHLLGRVALSQQKYDIAHKILARLADAGHALAQLDLARIYEEGLGIDANAFDAIKLYRLAAARGNPIALFRLAEKYALPNGPLQTRTDLANAIMSALVETYPNMFHRKEGCGRPGPKPPTDGEFAVQTAFQMTKMIKYLVILALAAFAGYVIFTEFIRP